MTSKSHNNNSKPKEQQINKAQNQFLQGQIIEGRGGLYTIRDNNNNNNTYVLRAKGKFRKIKITPLVGDNVLFTPGLGEEHGWIEEILPRKSISVRPPVANIELIAITIASAPIPDLLLVDRLLVGARQENIQTIIIFNKCELEDEGLQAKIRAEYANAQAPVFIVSAEENINLAPLKDAMRGKLCCMAGQSGVGKSTLLNALFGFDLQTGEISQRTERGRHTTRHASLLEKDGLRVLDTPGFSLLELKKNMEPIELQAYYPEFEPYEGQCKFAPCYHQSEPGCAVTKAAKQDKINKERLGRYYILLEELKQAWKERYN